MSQQRRASFLDWSLPLFRAFGVPVKLHWSFFFAVIFFVGQDLKWAQAAHGVNYHQGTALLWSLAHLVGLFTLVLAHEFGHSLAAISQGVGIHDIVLTPIGGLARSSGPMPGPKTDLLVTAAGPVVNLFIMVPTFGLMVVSGNDPVALKFFGEQMLPFLFFTNLCLAAFNLLPAFPMDGGRILAAAVSLKIEHTKAFAFAARVGYIFGAGLALLGLYMVPSTGGWLLVCIGSANIYSCYSLRKQLSAGAVAYAPAAPRAAGVANLDSGGLDGARTGGGMGVGGPGGGGAEQAEETGGDGYLTGPTEYQERSLRREEERLMRQRVDEILDKVRTGGTESLSSEEKNFLNQASRRFRQRH